MTFKNIYSRSGQNFTEHLVSHMGLMTERQHLICRSAYVDTAVDSLQLVELLGRCTLTDS